MIQKILSKIRNLCKISKIKTKETLPKLPRLKRVYSWGDLPKPVCGIWWDTINISDQQSLEKIYKHLSTAWEIVYYCTETAVQCSVYTRKYGWCLLTLHYSLCFTEFGIYKSMTRYDIYNVSDVMKYMPLYHFIASFVKRCYAEYQNDKNL